MAKALPFVVQPRRASRIIRIGSEDSGIMEIEQRGYLTVSEKFYVSQVTGDDKTLPLMIGLANKVGKITKKTNRESYELIAAYLQGESSAKDSELMESKFSEELQEITAEISRSTSTRELAQATVMMQSRIDEDWKTEDTFELHPDLLAALANLYQSEEAKEYPETEDVGAEQSQDAYEEALGKSEKDPVDGA